MTTILLSVALASFIIVALRLNVIRIRERNFRIKARLEGNDL